jgi:inhibitor of KinA
MNILPCGEQAVVLSLSYDDTAESAHAVFALYQAILRRKEPAILSLRPGLDCLAIEHKPGFGIRKFLASFSAESTKPELQQTSICRIPVCYEGAFAPDLAHVMEVSRLSKQEVIWLHTEQVYSVWMIGFMPGFPYLGPLPQRLQMSRKSDPDLKIAGGSVGIAEEYSGIYPFKSPAGWYVIGRTPLKIIDYRREKPWLLDYGMRVRFYPIDVAEYEALASKQSTN